MKTFSREDIEKAIRETFKIIEETRIIMGQEAKVCYDDKTEKEWQDKLVKDFFNNLEEKI